MYQITGYDPERRALWNFLKPGLVEAARFVPFDPLDDAAIRPIYHGNGAGAFFSARESAVNGPLKLDENLIMSVLDKVDAEYARSCRRRMGVIDVIDRFSCRQFKRCMASSGFDGVSKVHAIPPGQRWN
jgi:hypothetical protein